MACFTLFMKLLATPLSRNVVFVEDFIHHLKAFLYRAPHRCAVAAEHVALVLVLRSAAGSQGTRCAAVDSLFLESDV